MKISIITVSYNAASTIETTIKSVISQINQEIFELEYIIIDGASTDQTIDIINKYSDKISKFICEPDKGIYDAMNKGIKLASGDVIGILNADDHYAKDNILTLIAKSFLKDPALKIAYGDLVYINKEAKIVRYFKSGEFQTGSFAKGWCPAHPTFFVKKEIYQNFGLFNLKYKMGNDVELMARFLEKYQVKYLYLPIVMVNMRLGGISNSNVGNIITQNKCVLQALRDLNLPVIKLEFIFQKIIARIGQFLFRKVVN